MKRFNPEKELNKIKKGNKNKIILFVISLLVVGVIGYSFALYQVRYSKRIIYSKVTPFSSKDIQLAVSLDGKPQPNVPEKGTAYYESITCDDDKTATAGWDYKNWKLGAISVTIPNKCTINFTSHPTTLIDLIDYDYNNNPEIVTEDDTTDKNLRYIGKDPNNYIWFNCDSYDDLNQEAAKTQCEKWRIIGFMNNMTVIDGTTQEKIPNQSLVKIIRADGIEDIAWDTSNSNNWTRPATLQTSLTNYYNGKTLGSAKEIKESTKGMIEQVTWNIGGQLIDNNVTASQFYNAERGSTTPSGAQTTWDGYIGLMYPSDYGYATSGGSSTNRDMCLAYSLQSWSASGYKEDCAENDWLMPTSKSQWTITSSSARVFVVNFYGNVPTTTAYTPYIVRPTLYLKPNVQVKNGGGTGSFNEPYILVP